MNSTSTNNGLGKSGTVGHKLGIFSLSLLLFGNAFKQWPLLQWLSVDPAVIGALGALITVLYHMVIRFRVPRAIFAMLGLFVIVLPCLSWTQWNPYARDKAIRLFTITLAASISPPFIIREPRDLRALCNTITCMGLILSVSSLRGYLAPIGDVGRLTAYGMNPIWFARLVGMAALWPIISSLNGGEKPLSVLVISLPCLIALVGSGSKGPLVAFLVTFAVVMIFSFQGNVRHLLLGAVVVVLGCIAIVFGLRMAPELARDRIIEITRINMATIDISRSQAWSVCLELIPKNPLGIGLGGFSLHDGLLWPHNLTLEVFLETGWLGGIYLITLLLFTFRNNLIMSQLGGPEFIALGAYVLFEFLNAMVSGDFTSAKVLLALASMTLSMKPSTNMRLATQERVSQD